MELTRHFLADGVSHQVPQRAVFPSVLEAFVCEFLPLCLERAKANPYVTLGHFLEVLVDLLQGIRAAALNKGLLVQVDLADLAAFVLMVCRSV